jgi:hypothetical protein
MHLQPVFFQEAFLVCIQFNGCGVGVKYTSDIDTRFLRKFVFLQIKKLGQLDNEVPMFCTDVLFFSMSNTTCVVDGVIRL